MFFLFALIILFLIIFIIHTSKIGIEVNNLIIDTEKNNGEKINKDSKIEIYLLLFNKVKFLRRDVRNMKMPNLKIKKQDIDIKVFKNKELDINYIELLRNIDIDIKKMDLYMQIGTYDASITAITIGIISSLLGIIIKKPKYQIVPIYSGKNLIKIELNCIISIYLMQYIYIIINKKLHEKSIFHVQKTEE